MIRNEISKKYGVAIFELAKEKDKLSGVKNELDKIMGLIKDNDELNEVFFHPRIRPDTKKKIIHEIFKEQVSDLLFNYLYLLIDKRREFYLEYIIKEFKKLYNQEKKIMEVEVVSAITLNEKMKNKLQNKIKSKIDNKVLIKEKIDPSIIGGLIIKIGDHIIDGSIKNKLANLQNHIEKIPVSKLGVEGNES